MKEKEQTEARRACGVHKGTRDLGMHTHVLIPAGGQRGKCVGDGGAPCSQLSSTNL